MNDYDRPLCSACLIVARRVPATRASRYADHYAYCEAHAGPGDAPLTAPSPESAPQPTEPAMPALVNCSRCGAQRPVNTSCHGCPMWTRRTKKGQAV